ncbi:MAG: hypothetical protein H0W96_06695 [Solirubrobacterales bacterium]|nr:hypothetical protein [Solirubrobacterales bacterium]
MIDDETPDEVEVQEGAADALEPPEKFGKSDDAAQQEEWKEDAREGGN